MKIFVRRQTAVEIEDSLVLNLIAIKLEPQWLPTGGPHSTAKSSATSNVGRGRKKREKEQENKRGRPTTPERADRRQAQEKPAAGGRKEEPSRW